MKIDIGKIKRTGKTEECFEFAYAPSNQLVTLPNTTFDGDVKVNVKAYLLERDDLFVEGQLTVRLVGECSRCLKQTTFEFTIDFEEEFTRYEKEGAYSYFGGVVDLTKAVDDNIVMNMPMKILCSEECVGIEYDCDL